MIQNVVMPIPMPIYTGGISAENGPLFIAVLLVSWFLCIILGALFSFIAIRKHNQKADESKYLKKIRYREMFNPTVDIKHLSLDNMLGSVLLGIGYGGLCLMAFIAVAVGITFLIMG